MRKGLRVQCPPKKWSIILAISGLPKRFGARDGELLNFLPASLPLLFWTGVPGYQDEYRENKEEGIG